MMAVNLVKPMQLVDIIKQHDSFCYPFDFVIFLVVCILFSRTVSYNIMESTIKGAQCCKRGRTDKVPNAWLYTFSLIHTYIKEKKRIVH